MVMGVADGDEFHKVGQPFLAPALPSPDPT
jgi:hypothetical protein